MSESVCLASEGAEIQGVDQGSKDQPTSQGLEIAKKWCHGEYRIDTKSKEMVMPDLRECIGLARKAILV